MDAVSWLSVLFLLLVGVSYVLWCLDLLPGTRLLLVLASVVCLGAAVDLHGYLFGSQVTPPPPPVPGAQQ